MAIQTVAMRNALVNAYAAQATHSALYSTVPGAAAGTELTGGTPAYARRALTWPAAANSTASVTPTAFDVASGATVAGAGVHAGAAGAYLDGGAVTSQTFSSQGTYALTITYTQT